MCGHHVESPGIVGRALYKGLYRMSKEVFKRIFGLADSLDSVNMHGDFEGLI